MSAERDELLRLVQILPEAEVSQALADMRKHLPPVRVRSTVAQSYAAPAQEPSYWT